MFRSKKGLQSNIRKMSISVNCSDYVLSQTDSLVLSSQTKMKCLLSLGTFNLTVSFHNTLLSQYQMLNHIAF